MLSIIFALGSGLFFFINTMDMFYDMSIGFTPLQLNIDGNFVYSIALLPLFLYEQINYQTFSASHIGWAFVNVSSVTFGMISMGNAIKYGKAGPAQAIENTKTVW